MIFIIYIAVHELSHLFEQWQNSYRPSIGHTAPLVKNGQLIKPGWIVAESDWLAISFSPKHRMAQNE